MDSSVSSSGLLIGGSDNGTISIYDAKKIISGDVDDSIVFQSSKHTGNCVLMKLYFFVLTCFIRLKEMESFRKCGPLINL